jgi:hypothetical protein
MSGLQFKEANEVFKSSKGSRPKSLGVRGEHSVRACDMRSADAFHSHIWDIKP